MKDILQNEVNRQEYMEQKYRFLDEELNKNDSENGSDFHDDDNTNDETEI